MLQQLGHLVQHRARIDGVSIDYKIQSAEWWIPNQNCVKSYGRERLYSADHVLSLSGVLLPLDALIALSKTMPGTGSTQWRLVANATAVANASGSAHPSSAAGMQDRYP